MECEMTIFSLEALPGPAMPVLLWSSGWRNIMTLIRNCLTGLELSLVGLVLTLP